MMKTLLILLLACILPSACFAENSTLEELASYLHNQTKLTLTTARRTDDSLLIEYTLLGAAGSFEPSPAQLTELQSADSDLMSNPGYGACAPNGYVLHSFETPQLIASDGTRFTKQHGYTGSITENLLIRSESWELPNDLPSSDSLSLSIPVHHSITFMYYDGTQLLSRSFGFDFPALKASVQTDGHITCFSGTAEFNGVTCYLQAIHSANQLTAIVYTLNNFPVPADGQWIDLETNLDCALVTPTVRDSHTLVFTFDDVSELPQELKATLVIASDQGPVGRANFQIN